MDSIVTLTMNPALDITTDADVVRPTDKVRCTSVRYDPGGGGVNVAQVAYNLGASVTAVFPAGGATGDVYGDLLTARGVPFHRVKIAGSTRESFHYQRDQHRPAISVCAPGAVPDVCRTTAIPRRTPQPGGVGQV